mmetsp:Transcript_81385/g.212165  ORF Transcript_81385/g.212165 Transcript_81385/m.212165 type:complete len:87 (+) Transcript_81385:904-1164(+)
MSANNTTIAKITMSSYKIWLLMTMTNAEIVSDEEIARNDKAFGDCKVTRATPFAVFILLNACVAKLRYARKHRGADNADVGNSVNT